MVLALSPGYGNRSSSISPVYEQIYSPCFQVPTSKGCLEQGVLAIKPGQSVNFGDFGVELYCG